MWLTGKKRQRGNGFLLLEIMISVSILSTGLLLILSSFMRPIRATELSGDYFKAGLLLEEKILEVYNSDIKQGASEGVFSSFNNKFSWDLDISGSGDGSCMEVNLKIFWFERDKEKDLSISTCI